ncbi:hypothetical protein Tco_0583013 [Tanacetum coccineum]
MKPTEVDVSRASDKDGEDDQATRINAAKTSEEHLFEQFSPFKNAFSLPDVPNVSPMDDNTRIFAGAYDDEDVGGHADLVTPPFLHIAVEANLGEITVVILVRDRCPRRKGKVDIENDSNQPLQRQPE